MRDHPIPGAGIAPGVPVPAADKRELQRWLLLELVTSPPTAGDRLEYLAHALDGSRAAVEAAVGDLVAVGLAVREGDRIRASAAAWRFDQLWPHETPF
jgi:hypothetical protein